jgi:hypothetical protein
MTDACLSLALHLAILLDPTTKSFVDMIDGEKEDPLLIAGIDDYHIGQRQTLRMMVKF